MSSQVEEKSIPPPPPKKKGPWGGQLAPEQGPALDSTSRSGTERPMATKSDTGNVTEKVSETESKSKVKSQFQAGMLKHFLSQWQELISDEFVLEMVQGAKIHISDFTKLPAKRKKEKRKKKKKVPKQLWSDMDQEVENRLALGVIQRTQHEEDEVISLVFLVQKLMVLIE